MSWFSKNFKLICIASGAAISSSSFTWMVNGNKSNTSINSVEKAETPQLSFVGHVLELKPSTTWDKNWDKREPANLVKPQKPKPVKDSTVEHIPNEKDLDLQKYTSKANRHLLLIRHGQYNTDSHEDDKRILSNLGKDQADLTGFRLNVLNFPYAHIIHSSMTRAKETAAIIHKHMPKLKMHQCDLLREGAPFPPEPPSIHWKPEYKLLTDGARIEAAFRKYFHRAPPEQETDSYEIIVCHANVIRYFVCRALQLPPEAWLRMSLNHASVTWVTIKPNGHVILRSLGDAGHMPPDKISHL